MPLICLMGSEATAKVCKVVEHQEIKSVNNNGQSINKLAWLDQLELR